MLGHSGVTLGWCESAEPLLGGLLSALSLPRETGPQGAAPSPLGPQHPGASGRCRSPAASTWCLVFGGLEGGPCAPELLLGTPPDRAGRPDTEGCRPPWLCPTPRPESWGQKGEASASLQPCRSASATEAAPASAGLAHAGGGGEGVARGPSFSWLQRSPRWAPGRAGLGLPGRGMGLLTRMGAVVSTLGAWAGGGLRGRRCWLAALAVEPGWGGWPGRPGHAPVTQRGPSYRALGGGAAGRPVLTDSRETACVGGNITSGLCYRPAGAAVPSLFVLD